MNRLILRAQVVERQATRYTPAGLPAIDLRLSHASEVPEAGSTRKISMEIAAVAIGDVTRGLQAVGVGTEAVFTGFLAKQRNGRGVVFHINEFDPVTGP